MAKSSVRSFSLVGCKQMAICGGLRPVVKFCGSKVMYDKAKRRWYAVICAGNLTTILKPKAAGTRRASLEAGEQWPFNFTVDGKNIPLNAGRGQDVAWMRHNVKTRVVTPRELPLRRFGQ